MGRPPTRATAIEEPIGAEDSLERIELDLLLEGIARRYGYDFRGYALGSLSRGVLRRARAEGTSSLSGLQEKVLHDPKCMERLLDDLSINVTSAFRDPAFYATLRARVVPILRTYPFIRVWTAGCSTGEEAYSVAILLEEEGLYDRARIYATDVRAAPLDLARAGVIPPTRLDSYAEEYARAGGRRKFGDYCVAVPGGGIRFHPRLSENLVFAQHNLVSDRSFNEFHLILCRNVMIYFGKMLQDRVHGLLHESLARLGVLALGRRETIRFSSHERLYEPLDTEEKLYRRVS